jgi:general secretion pathway protein G
LVVVRDWWWSVIGRRGLAAAGERWLATIGRRHTQDSINGQRGQAGYTFVEMLVVATILLVLASAIMPLAKVTSQRMREAELRRALREMRTAIDKYKDAADTGQIGSLDIKAGSENYPPDLETLVEGVTAANDATGRKLKYLRKIPTDPMTRSTEWGLRSYQDKPDSTRWGGQNVFDVYTTSDATALDGTKYKDW